MARRRPKIRVDHLAAALNAAQGVRRELLEIDLRTLRGDLRGKVRLAREANASTITEISDALPPRRGKPGAGLLTHDVPSPARNSSEGDGASCYPRQQEGGTP